MTAEAGHTKMLEDLDLSYGPNFITEDMPSKNPFVHSINVSLPRRIQMWIFAIFVFPIRLFFMIVFLILTLLFGELATRRMDTSKPMSGFRKHFLLPAFVFCGRALYFCGGFIWIQKRGKRASCEEAPILVLAPHSSFYDSLVFLSLGMPSVVGKVETAQSAIGSFIKMTQPILVNREDPQSRQNTLAEIRRRALSGGKWPQILIFPEGTCTNRSCLINYKQGAFTVGCAVQPAILRWGYGVDSITWTWEGPGVLELLFLTAIQPFTTLEIEVNRFLSWFNIAPELILSSLQFLPVYVPSEEEKDDPQLFAKNVRAVMAKAVNLPTTELGFDDCHRIRKAVQFNLPMACHINEYGKLTKYLFREPRVEGRLPASQVPQVTERLLGMATAVRAFYGPGGCGYEKPLRPSQLARLFLYPHPTPTSEYPLFVEHFGSKDAFESRFNLLRRIVVTLPKTFNDQPDLRALVIHLCFLMFSSSPHVAMQLAFQCFESVNGDGSHTNAATGTGDDAAEKFTSWAISTEDATRLLTTAYHLSSKEAATLLVVSRNSSSKQATMGGGTSGPNNSNTAGTTSDNLVQLMRTHHPKLLSSYEDYKAELCRLRGVPERGLCETSTSNSICSLHSVGSANGLNGDQSSTACTSQSGHRRDGSDVSSASSLDDKEPLEPVLRKRNVPL